MSGFEICLVTPPLGDADDEAHARVLAAVAQLAPASLLVRLAAGDERALINAVKRIAPPVQQAGVAVVVEASPVVAVRGGADGVHVLGSPAVAAARAALKGERSVGAGWLKSRHDAMDAAEAGADYVMFGEPRADGSVPALSGVVERAAWWAEIFETPCIAYVPDAAALRPLAATRAEFLALGPWALAALDEAALAIATARAAAAARGPVPV